MRIVSKRSVSNRRFWPSVLLLRVSQYHRHRLQARPWERTRRAAFERDGWRCVECGRPGRLEAHHITALHNGGAPYDLDNLETLCRPCHIDRHRRKLSPGEAAWRVLVDDLMRMK